MKRVASKTSLGAQLLGLVSVCFTFTAAAAFAVSLHFKPGVNDWPWTVLSAGLILTAAAFFAGMIAWIGRIARSVRLFQNRVAAVITGEMPADVPPDAPTRELRHLHASFGQMIAELRQTRMDFERSQQKLALRTRTVDRLLEFSQTIQGAGRIDQIFPPLCHFLVSELGLAGMTILSYDADPSPAVQVRAAYPEGVIAGPLAEFDPALCPCLRQSQPRLFRPGDAPVRCTIDQYLSMGAPREAYCIPFAVGRRSQFVLHMLLPEGQIWTEPLRQLAQTYANTAQSTLSSLHLLAEAEKQSMTDGLTGLYNRRSLDALLQREVALAERHDQPLSVVMIDMDYFKQINDTHGHAAGDHLLRAFADCVRITLRKTDLAFRYGGDEFVIALPQTPIAQAQQVVQKLRQAFAAVDFSSAITNLQAQPTLSIGLAERSAAMNVLTLTALLSAADQALYDAKSISRNCVRTYQPPRAA